MKPYDHHIFVCTCPTCSKKDAESVLLAFRQKVEKQGLLDKVKVTRTSCLSRGECKHGSFVVVYPQGVWYRLVTVNDVDEIIEKHLVGGQLVSRLLHLNLHAHKRGHGQKSIVLKKGSIAKPFAKLKNRQHPFIFIWHFWA